MTTGVRKDEGLEHLAAQGINVAQFIGFEPVGEGVRQTYCRIAGREANEVFSSPLAALQALLAASPSGSINIRSYAPGDSQSRDFIYGIQRADHALADLLRLTKAGLHTIADETIDFRDGGVSGAIFGYSLIEFSPDATPCCVEKSGVCSLPFHTGYRMLRTVYGVPLDLPALSGTRVEFSLHPSPQGWQQTNAIAWKSGNQSRESIPYPTLDWPNNFSRLIGDKVFCLLMAFLHDFNVPITTVINRRIAPFIFGHHTQHPETWIRTVPPEPVPGRHSTFRGWRDPFELLAAEDPDGTQLVSVVAQQGVRPGHSGACITGADGEPILEGKQGTGDSLMLGESLPESLPQAVKDDVLTTYREALATFGPVRMEWVHDGRSVWVVQLHRGATGTSETVLVPGDSEDWRELKADLGLPAIRAMVAGWPAGTGLLLRGRVGLTSHIADVIRQAGRPARILP